MLPTTNKSKEFKSHRRLMKDFFVEHKTRNSVRNKIQSTKTCGSILSVETDNVTTIAWEASEVNPMDEASLFAKDWRAKAGPGRDQKSHKQECEVHISAALQSLAGRDIDPFHVSRCEHMARFPCSNSNGITFGRDTKLQSAFLVGDGFTFSLSLVILSLSIISSIL
ncbi:unnamed protein product [Cochlearia groenlandica]